MPVTGSAIRRWVSFTIRRGRSDAFEAIVDIDIVYVVITLLTTTGDDDDE
jgi:hypothetical protein